MIAFIIICIVCSLTGTALLIGTIFSEKEKESIKPKKIVHMVRVIGLILFGIGAAMFICVCLSP